MNVLHVELPGLPPSANRLWRYVGGKVLKSREYRVWLDGAATVIQLKAKGGIIEGPWKVFLDFYGMDRRRDVDNAIKPVLDALVAAGVVSDDRWCDFIAASREDSERPMTAITVTTAG